MDGEKIQAEKRFSRVREGIRTYGSPLVTLATLIVVAGNLTATAKMSVSLEDLLETGIVKSSPQEIVSEWRSLPGIQSRIVTPRNRNESDASVAARHAAAVAALTEAFIPEK